MLEKKDLQRGYWLRSIGDLLSALVTNPFAWLGLGLLVITYNVATPKVSYAGATEDEFFMVAAMGAAGIAFVGTSLFLIFRKMNAEIINRSQLQQPIYAQAELAEGSAYRFDIVDDGTEDNLKKQAEKRAALSRKMRVAQKNASIAQDEEAEVTVDLVNHYEQELEKIQMRIDALAERYHVPKVELTFQMRIKNTDEYRVANILDVVANVDFPTKLWAFKEKGTFSIDGDRSSFPITLNPGESFVGTHRCVMEPRSGLTQEKLADYLKRQSRSSFPVTINVGCDDTYDDLSVTELPVRVSLAPLKDEFESRWRKSEFLKG